MRTRLSVLWTLALVLLVSTLAIDAANSGRSSPNKPALTNANQQVTRLNAKSENTKQVSDSVTNLAAKIANALSSSKSKTEIFSPVSIAGALSLLLLGSGGQTQKELLRVMGLDTLPLSFQDIHVSFGRLFQDLVANDPSLEPLVTWRLNDKCNRYDEEEEEDDDDFPAPAASNPNEFPSNQISVTNGIFLQHGLKPADRYLALAQQVYKGAVENFDFEREPASAAAFINDWCSRATRGKIREIVTEDILRNSRMIVANALYFKAQWETTFSPLGTRQRSFYPYGKLEPPISAETMATSGCFPYYNATAEYGVQIIGLPYEKGQSTMYIILPNESNRQILREKLATISALQLNWLIDRMVMKKATVLLPKLNISNRIRLSSVLERLGVRDLFDSVRSNLTGMFKDNQADAASDAAVQSGTSSRVDTIDETKQRPSTSKPIIKPVGQKPTPTTVKPVQPRPQPSTNAVNSITLNLAARDCLLIENCQPKSGDACSCNLIPSSENAACGAHLAGHYYNTENKHCYYGIPDSSMKINICIKPIYKAEYQFQNLPAACQQRSNCKMFKDMCYCCSSNLEQKQRPPTPSLPATNGQTFGVSSRLGEDDKMTFNTERPPAQPAYNGYQMQCEIVPYEYCSYRGYEWDPYREICIDRSRCRTIRIQKRQAPAYSSANQPRDKLVPQPELGGSWQQQQQSNPVITQQYQQPGQNLQLRTQQQQQLQQRQGQQQLQQNVQQQSVHVNEIITHVTLDVNEQGTEGGAVTVALIDRIGPDLSFVVDGPFLILLRSDVTRLPLFYGTVYDPRT